MAATHGFDLRKYVGWSRLRCLVASLVSIGLGSLGVWGSWYDWPLAEWSGLGVLGVLYGFYFLSAMIRCELTTEREITIVNASPVSSGIANCRSSAENTACRQASRHCDSRSGRGLKVVCRANRRSLASRRLT